MLSVWNWFLRVTVRVTESGHVCSIFKMTKVQFAKNSAQLVPIRMPTWMAKNGAQLVPIGMPMVSLCRVLPTWTCSFSNKYSRFHWTSFSVDCISSTAVSQIIHPGAIWLHGILYNQNPHQGQS